jgi:hypothetical protein
MPKPGPSTTYEYSDDFKATAVRLSELAGVSVNAHTELREDVYQQYRTLSDERAKSTIDRAIVDVADARGVLLLINSASARRKPFQATGLYTALRHVLVGQRPSAGWPGIEEMHSVPASELRKELFAIVVDRTAADAARAEDCLIAIDQMRDDYGDVASERRHPGIARGLPWPRVRGIFPQ